MRLSFRGIAYLVITGAVLFALSYSGSVILLWFLLLLLLLPLFSALQLIISIRGVSVNQTLVQNPVTRQDKARLRLGLQQKKGRPPIGLLDLGIERQSQRGKKSSLRRQTVLLAKDHLQKEILIPCPHRGRYRIGLGKLRARDLFGLFYLPVRRAKTLRKKQTELLVWPKSIDLGDEFSLANLPELREQMLSKEFSDEIDAVANLRGFQPGDSMKRIHWNLTARLHEIMIKEFEKPLQQESLLLYDVDADWLSPENETAYFDRYTDFAAGLARQIASENNPLRSLWYTPQGRQSVRIENEDKLSLIFSQLSDLGYAGNYSLEQILNEERRQNPQPWTLFWLTNHVREESVQQLLQYTDRRYTICLILLAAGDVQEAVSERQLDRLAEQGIPAFTLPVFENDDRIAADSKPQTTKDKEKEAMA